MKVMKAVKKYLAEKRIRFTKVSKPAIAWLKRYKFENYTVQFDVRQNLNCQN